MPWFWQWSQRPTALLGPSSIPCGVLVSNTVVYSELEGKQGTAGISLGSMVLGPGAEVRMATWSGTADVLPLPLKKPSVRWLDSSPVCSPQASDCPLPSSLMAFSNLHSGILAHAVSFSGNPTRHQPLPQEILGMGPPYMFNLISILACLQSTTDLIFRHARAIL